MSINTDITEENQIIGERAIDRPFSVDFSTNELIVILSDGRKVCTPLKWYPKLLKASPEQRANYELSSLGVHWDELDEDLSVYGMLKGTASVDYSNRSFKEF